MSMSNTFRRSARLFPLATVAMLAACGESRQAAIAAAAVDAPQATPGAECGPGSHPETAAMQGRVTQEDHDSGRVVEGFTCNTELVGSYTVPTPLGFVGGFKVERYVDAAGHECAYYDTTTIFPVNVFSGEVGVNVLDMSDPSHPALTTRLLTPAMLSPHESLVLSKERGLLAAVLGNLVFGPGVVDVYDVSQDCRQPGLKASAPVGTLGHESGMAPDGRTFYSASSALPTLTAVDISNPSLPLPLAITNIKSHGLSVSADGNRLYVADLIDRELLIMDSSEIQARKPNPQLHEVGHLSWDIGSIPQNAIPITIKGHSYVVEIDEFATNGNSYIPAANGSHVGAGRIIDIGDEKNPRVISDLRLEVHQPKNRAVVAQDPGAQDLIGGYAGHYCNVPTRVDPLIVACSMIMSGLRIFDIRDPYHPREVAYFHSPVGSARESNSAFSSPSFVPERKEIWYTDSNSGFYAVRVTNGAWPDP